MNISGEILLGNKVVKGSCSEIYAINPATNEKMSPAFFGATKADVNVACELAQSTFDTYRNISLERRATFLETIADEIFTLGDTLIQRAMAESGLPQMRIEGERGRTMGQLKLFAGVVRAGNWVDVRIDPAMPERTPLPRSDLRLRHIPLGPVAVFGASNFPLAFSVAGGDTASALAAGCPVIVKAHSAHPGTSELVGKAIISAANKCQMPEGVFSLLFASGTEVGADLVAHPAIKAVGFTGSRSGGVALMNIAANRPEPIPVYAEMSSINPVFLLPHSLAKNAKSLASGFVSSLTLGAGQFCTNPGLVIGLVSDELNEFIRQAQTELTQSPAQTMLTAGIHKDYVEGIQQLVDNNEVAAVATGQASTEPNRCQAKIFQTTAQQFISDPSLTHEVFGSTSLIVSCQSPEEMLLVAEYLEGQLTATMQLNNDDINVASQLLTILERKVGRVLCNGYPTGVEVCHSMVHGGPFPATSDSRTTSVGSAAILRFLRPVSYQDMPAALLPEELKDDNSLALNRLIDGKVEK